MTSYNQPRRLNFVSFIILLAVLAGAYAGWKFIPVYWKARELDTAIDELLLPVADRRRHPDARKKDAELAEAQIIAKAHEFGIQDLPDQPVEVWWDGDFDVCHVKYRVIVEHPAVLKPTILTMERVRKVPNNR